MKVILIKSPKHGDHECLVDDSDFDYLNQFKWYIFKSRHFVYAIRMDYNRETKKSKIIFMHREIMGLLDSKKRSVFVDHEDHNTLNNQRYNLRNSSNAQNQMNKIPRGKSKYLGVWYNRGSIVSKIRINKKQVTVGQGFKTEEDAARAYDEMAKKHHGEFANLNFKTT